MAPVPIVSAPRRLRTAYLRPDRAWVPPERCQIDRDDGAKNLEILVLRHQLRVLQRTAGRPQECHVRRPRVQECRAVREADVGVSRNVPVVSARRLIHQDRPAGDAVAVGESDGAFVHRMLWISLLTV